MTKTDDFGREAPEWLFQIPLQARAGLSVNDAATYLGVGRSTIYNLLKDGAIRSAHIRGRNIVL